MSMNIGFDFDKIFIDYPPFVPDRLIDRLYKDPRPYGWGIFSASADKEKSNGILSYRIPSKPEQFLRLLTHLPPFRPPIVSNIQFVRGLSQKNNHKYYIISSRFSFLRKRTQDLIKKYAFDKIFDGMFFNFEDKQPHIFKNEIVKKLKLDYYVDDDFLLLRFLASKNPKTKFFWLNKKENELLENNITAITKLSQMHI